MTRSPGSKSLRETQAPPSPYKRLLPRDAEVDVEPVELRRLAQSSRLWSGAARRVSRPLRSMRRPLAWWRAGSPVRVPRIDRFWRP
jgi:hypothetical protein